MKTVKKTYEIGEGDFEQAFGRKPKDDGELDDFAHYCYKGMEAQLDWDIIYKCAREAMG